MFARNYVVKSCKGFLICNYFDTSVILRYVLGKTQVSRSHNARYRDEAAGSLCRIAILGLEVEI